MPPRRLRAPLPIGDGRALVQLPSGEYLCVDTRTLDGFPYLLGWDHEGDVIRVFRTFLTPRSVVLDVGANVGLYTAIAANVVRNHGRLYAFEGNPRVFGALHRTIIANELYVADNIVIANVLVSDRSGRGMLYYTDEAPSGGTMSDVPLVGGERRSVEVAMTTIDDYLPPDLAVDLVKIDVEGHEPLVLRGMEQTIARSPNIRIIIEFVDHMLRHTSGVAQSIDYIRSLGLGICRLKLKFQLEPVPSGESISGFNYLLLTRTPDADCAAVERRRRQFAVRFKRFLTRNRPAWGRYGRLWRRL